MRSIIITVVNTTRTPERSLKKTSPTAFLLICAALAVAAALLGVANRFAQTIALAVAPHALALLLPIAVLAPSIAAHLLRRPGAALLTASMAGLLALPFSPSGAGVFQALGAVIVGLALEGPFALLRYRRFPWWASVLGALIVAGVLCAVHWTLWGMNQMHPVATTLMVASITVGAIGWALVGMVVGRRLSAIGLAHIPSAQTHDR